MSTTEKERFALPFRVQRRLRKFSRGLRQAITLEVQGKMDEQGGHLTAEDIGECASRVILNPGHDRTMEALCLEALDSGKSKPLTDVINELRSRTTRPAEL